ncbi:hypothetical protein GGX14DRAFT_666502 [Mycena pura]|uniref:Uncharacterized protein n=1 Tax=Mycena pura TaxID=153505 RepID=A0AAD6Y2Q6_9AGAR|nr:hypothetical protein GGX14DRAFT_666502 [Mycena pura]
MWDDLVAEAGILSRNGVGNKCKTSPSPLDSFLSIQDPGKLEKAIKYQIGVARGVWGVLNTVFLLFVAARPIRRFGMRNAVGAYPLLSVLARRALRVDALVWAVVVVQGVSNVTLSWAYAAMQMYIVNSAPRPSALSSTNGIAQMTATTRPPRARAVSRVVALRGVAGVERRGRQNAEERANLPTLQSAAYTTPGQYVRMKHTLGRSAASGLLQPDLPTHASELRVVAGLPDSSTPASPPATHGCIPIARIRADADTGRQCASRRADV